MTSAGLKLTGSAAQFSKLLNQTKLREMCKKRKARTQSSTSDFKGVT